MPNNVPLPCFLDISFNIQHEEFGTIRTLTIDDEPWFVGKDVASILGYTNASKALADHVDNEDKLNNDSLLSLGQRGGWLINESGLYSLILSSKLPKAKEFKRWVTSEVLPSIRNQKFYLKRIYPYNRNMPFFFIQEHWEHDHFTSCLVLV